MIEEKEELIGQISDTQDEISGELIASGNIVTLSSLNTWDHYIMFGSNAISKIE